MSADVALVGAPGDADVADAGRLLDVLENPTARCILASTGDRPITASELAERCAVPNSTMYRQLGALVDVGLVRKSVRIDPSGHHAAQYDRVVSDISISIESDAGVRIDLS